MYCHLSVTGQLGDVSTHSDQLLLDSNNQTWNMFDWDNSSIKLSKSQRFYVSILLEILLTF